jgi:tetratricopeptide (TPR) repeat protein
MAQEPLQTAMSTYDNGDYSKSVELFRQIPAEKRNAVWEYNMGNALFKEGKLGESIFYFKKAHRSAPRDADVAFNLGFARTKALDKIEDTTPAWWRFVSLQRLFNLTEAFLFLSVLSFFFWAFLLLSFYRKMPLFVTLRLVAGILFVVVGLICAKDWFFSGTEGVVSGKEVSVYSATGKDSIVLFVLHEGTEFAIRDESNGDWARIELLDGKKGWIKKDQIIFETQ